MGAAEMLRAARRQAGLSQRRLATRSGIPQPAIARIESGRVIPKVDTLTRLLGACGMTLESRQRPGYGIDRTTIRALLKLTPDERVRYAAESSSNVGALISEMRRQL